MKTLIRAGVLACAMAAGVGASMQAAAQPPENIGAAVFNKKGSLLLPQGYRQWVFIGAPLTPHGLNNGKAGFPEFHHVYVNPDA
ncbi:MAG TPA: chain A cytochrome P460, partial [Gammaproteobacteria bacterium]|nr:chain A cytochrome P460 [Gammaproteobacteria bacterium]